MALRPGTRLGHYEIHSLRGKGGMGEVYRSRDVRLDRTVAIKILPSAFAADAELRRRFEREAKAVAALSHPHICALYDVGEEPDPDHPRAEPVQFLVMEYLDGETLDEALRRKPLSQDHVLRIAIQIAQALDKAHRSGIVHRDLKPGNIMLTASGVKLLDFGLAQFQPAAVDRAQTITTSGGTLTTEGTILGTPHYMAPEQVEGKATDPRSDLFAFGAIVYEMVTGKRAFDGPSIASVMAAIVDREPPPMLQLQPLASPLLDHVVTRCLAKDRDERWQSASDVMRELSWIAERGATVTAATGRREPGRWRERTLWIAGLAILAALAGFAFLRNRGGAPTPAEMRLSIATPPTFDRFAIAIAPDGQKIVFVADADGRGLLWLYHMKTGVSEPLTGTDNPQFPFWSPDSRSIGFASSGLLKRLDLESGVVRRVANAPLFLGGSWNADGTILFVPGANSRVFRVSAGSEGEATPVTTGRSGALQSFPHALPDGRHFLYHETAPDQPAGVYVGNVDGSPGRRLLDADATATYVAPDHLLFIRQRTLWAQRFDPVHQAIDGTPFKVVDPFVSRVFAGARIPAMSASRTGSIIYWSVQALPPLQSDIRWRDRSGKELAGFSSAPVAVLNPALSPDDRKMTMFRGSDIWILNLQTGAFDKFTFHKGLEFAPIWSPDGSRIVFSSDSSGMLDLYVKNASGAGGEELLLQTGAPTDPTDWSLDGKYLLYRTLSIKNAYDIWAVSMADRKSFPVLATEHDERDAQFSPDGTMIAYQSNETGRFEVWVRPFPFPGLQVNPNDKVQISTTGGTQARWSRNGSEILFAALDGTLKSVPIQIDAKAHALTKGTPVDLFSLGRPLWGGGAALPFYDISSDGKRILTTTTVLSPSTSPISVILNWQPQPPTR